MNFNFIKLLLDPVSNFTYLILVSKYCLKIFSHNLCVIIYFPEFLVSFFTTHNRSVLTKITFDFKPNETLK